jgi:hypothetical protein
LRGGGLGEGAQSRSQLVVGCVSQLLAPLAASKSSVVPGAGLSHS